MIDKLYKAGKILREDGLTGTLSATRKSFSAMGSSYIANRMANRILSNAVDTPELRTSIATKNFIYAEESEFEISESDTSQQLPEGIQSYCGTYSANQLVASVIQDAIVNDSSIALTRDGKLISQSIGHSERVLSWIIRRKIQQNPVKIISKFKTKTYSDLIPDSESQVDLGFFMIRHWSYFHWVTEFLPNLRALQAYESATGETPTILIEQDPPDYVLEYLRIAGYEDYVKQLPSPTVSVRRLILPSRRVRGAHDYNPCPEDLAWVREYFTNRVSDSGDNHGNRIYISRSDTTNRRIINEAGLVSKLKERGFESIKLSELSISEQIKLFQGADYVIGPHGGGFTNTIFADSITIFELFPKGGVRHFYYSFAQQLGFDYEFLIASDSINKNGDFLIDVDAVTKKLDELIYQ